ncbi:MAG: hypothetical protein JWM11_4211 [Planctomycetaceae bacterium]|nr:hypothetical protein [Planctomycetaceae bacterium]
MKLMRFRNKFRVGKQASARSNRALQPILIPPVSLCGLDGFVSSRMAAELFRYAVETARESRKSVIGIGTRVAVWPRVAWNSQA